VLQIEVANPLYVSVSIKVHCLITGHRETKASVLAAKVRLNLLIVCSRQTLIVLHLKYHLTRAVVLPNALPSALFTEVGPHNISPLSRQSVRFEFDIPQALCEANSYSFVTPNLIGGVAVSAFRNLRKLTS
jgi:hypothetical protein